MTGQSEPTRINLVKEDEDGALEEAFRQVTKSAARRPTIAEQTAHRVAPEQNPQGKGWDKNRKIILISVCACVAVLLICIILGVCLIANNNRDDGRIYNQVSAAGINLGGMTPDEAKSALHAATDSTFSKKDMVVRLPGQTLTLAPADTGVTLDVDAVVEQAYRYGRDGQSTTAGAYTIALLPYLNLNLTYIRSTVEDFSKTYSSTLTPPTAALVGERPTYDPENPDAAVTHQILRVTLGTPEFVLDAEDLYNAVLDAYSLNRLQIDYEAPSAVAPEAPDLRKLFDEFCTSPEDATLNPVTFVVTPEVYGYGFDPVQAQQLLDQAAAGETVDIPLSFLKPEITSDDLTGDLFQDLLATYTSVDSTSDADRNNNLAISCQTINGTVIKPGQVFSLSAIIGSPTGVKGYKTASDIVDGKPGKMLGGGISQTASTLYYAALMADLDVLSRTGNALAVNYVPLGLDAAFQYGVSDLQVRNNTAYPIRIQAEANGGRVTVSIMGTDEKDYFVQLEYELVNELAPATVYQTMIADNVQGYHDGDILQEGCTGYDVRSFLCKYRKNGSALISRTQIAATHYNKLDEIVVRIEQQSTDPTETT